MDSVTKDFDERDWDRFHVVKGPDKKAWNKKREIFESKTAFFVNHVETCNHPRETTTVFHGCFKFRLMVACNFLSFKNGWT